MTSAAARRDGRETLFAIPEIVMIAEMTAALS
jgi:hypothetical protein